MIVGVFLLAGFTSHVVGRRAHIPRVTLLLVLGLLASPSVLNLVPAEASDWFPLASKIALSMIGFQLGERFLGRKLRRTGAAVFTISLAEVIASSVFVFVVLYLFGFPTQLALLFASVAPATAPAATHDVVREIDASGPVADMTLSVVAIDDAWGVILFSLLVAVAQVFSGSAEPVVTMTAGVREVIGAVLLGTVLGVPMAWVTGRVREGELTLLETLGFVFICSGLAVLLDLSLVLACMSMGATVSNVAKHHVRPFHTIEQIEQPFLVLFFLLAGFHCDVGTLWTIGPLGLAYLLARSFGKVTGALLGGTIARTSPLVRSHLGWCLLPQAGVALGLALTLAERYPETGSRLLSVIVGTTVVFEIIGPLATRMSLSHAGEIASDD